MQEPHLEAEETKRRRIRRSPRWMPTRRRTESARPATTRAGEHDQDERLRQARLASRRPAAFTLLERRRRRATRRSAGTASESGRRSNTAVQVGRTGKVVNVGRLGTYGLTVIIDHGGGDYSIYGSLSRSDVEKADGHKGPGHRRRRASPTPSCRRTCTSRSVTPARMVGPGSWIRRAGCADSDRSGHRSPSLPDRCGRHSPARCDVRSSLVPLPPYSSATHPLHAQGRASVTADAAR